MNNNRFDCVIIGGGIGGMCAASLLAHSWYRVLVGEKSENLGGRFSTMVIDGFKCPQARLLLCAAPNWKIRSQ